VKAWHLSQLISLHCVCIPPAEHRLTSSVGWPGFFFHLSSSVCGGGIVLICLPHQLFLPHSPYPFFIFYFFTRVMLWHFCSCPVSCLLIALFHYHHDSENFLTPLEMKRKSLFNVSPPTPRNSYGDFHSLLRWRRVLYFWKVVCFWGRSLINVTMWRYYIGFLFRDIKTKRSPQTFALWEKKKKKKFRCFLQPWAFKLCIRR